MRGNIPERDIPEANFAKILRSLCNVSQSNLRTSVAKLHFSSTYRVDIFRYRSLIRVAFILLANFNFVFFVTEFLHARRAAWLYIKIILQPVANKFNKIIVKFIARIFIVSF